MKLIFLGCGYLGYNLSEQLSKYYDVQVIGLDSPYTKLSNKFTYLDAFNDEFDDTFEDAIVFDSISVLSNNAISDNEDEKLLQISNLYEKLFGKLKTYKIKKYYFLSSGGTIYGNSSNPISENHEIHPRTLYAKSKALIEQLLINSGLNFVVLRLTNPYGGYQVTDKKQGVIPIYIERTLKNEEFELWGTPHTIRDYIYIDDFANAVHLCIENNIINQIVNVGSGTGASLQDIFNEVEKDTQLKTKVKTIPSDVPIVESIVLDITKLKQLTGFEPKVSLSEGIKKEIQRIQEELV
ncbi:NAD-dependent epimerase/dehydratase family protein [Anaerorhabdus sp.]|uniref:NAD-dependent epimerase/dehydratase family protein n=1 Tax=Anaerorhabdus sp. TaxID=1872524 RepID=UPI002B210600|nr:NAD-dependent epimerase/dehydratase family protein [Anaerorhabdus sp.]MEA4874890.1 NAD-dependent epimerase/dehydratase family protein [Anaerorhabdus sp.]